MAKLERTDVRGIGSPSLLDQDEIRKKREHQRNMKWDAAAVEEAFKRIYADRKAAKQEKA